MKRRTFIQSVSTSAAALGLPALANLPSEAGVLDFPSPAPDARKIFIWGGGTDKAILNYLLRLTGKGNPHVCFIPTATGDSVVSITNWYALVEGLPLRPHVMKVFIDSYKTKESFEETLMKMDAVIVGGGNTLNMMAIWRSQGIDVALRKAYDAGILMSGASAGSLCWFEAGTTDSRPKELSKVECLGWIKTSHCPHYDVEGDRRPLYHKLILKKELSPGYACDNQSGIYFENETFVRSVSSNPKSKSFFVDVVDGKIRERDLKAEPIS
jgi:dipeptidase E